MNNTIYLSIFIIIVCCLINGIELFVVGSSFVMESNLPEAMGRLPTIFTRTVCPTRNMSYDLRKTMAIKRDEWTILNSTIGPINPDKCISHGIDDI